MALRVRRALEEGARDAPMLIVGNHALALGEGLLELWLSAIDMVARALASTFGVGASIHEIGAAAWAAGLELTSFGRHCGAARRNLELSSSEFSWSSGSFCSEAVALNQARARKTRLGGLVGWTSSSCDS